jgi:hypothetical protein
MRTVTTTDGADIRCSLTADAPLSTPTHSTPTCWRFPAGVLRVRRLTCRGLARPLAAADVATSWRDPLEWDGIATVTDAANELLQMRIANTVATPWSNTNALRLEVTRYGRRHRARHTPPECMLVQLRALCRAAMLPKLAGPDRAWATVVLERIVQIAVLTYFDDVTAHVPA